MADEKRDEHTHVVGGLGFTCNGDGSTTLSSCRPIKDGDALQPGEEVLHRCEDGLYRSGEVVKSSGPAQVATAKYRSNWDVTFGGKRAEVGIA